MSELKPIDQFRGQLDKMSGQFQVVLASHIPVEKYNRIVMTAVQRDPALLDADRRSLLMACIQCAQDGLLPDGREAALVIFRTKDGPKVTYMPMVYGIRKKVYQSGQVKSFNARVVYEGDDFDFAQGTEEWIRHRPTLSGRGKLIAAYAVATFRDGSQEFDVLSIDDVEKVRQSSRSPDRGPWAAWYDEMAKKTAIRRLAKALPLSSEVMDVISRDDHLVTLPRSQYRGDVQPHRTEREQAQAAITSGQPRTLDDFAAQQTEPAAGESSPAVAEPQSVATGADAVKPAPDQSDDTDSGVGTDPDYKAGFSAGLEGKTKRSMPADVRSDEARADIWHCGLGDGLKARGQQETESEEAEV